MKQHHSDRVEGQFLFFPYVGSLVAICLTLLAILSRIHFFGITTIEFQSLSLSILLCTLPAWVYWKMRQTTQSFDLVRLTQITLAFCFGVVCLGFLPFGLIFLRLLMYFVSAAVFFWLSRQVLRKQRSIALILIPLSALLGIWLGAKIWSAQYLSPIFMVKIETLSAHPDELLHMSVSSMIQTYGIASTGVDGLVRLPYHVGSHVIFAQFAKLLGASTVDTYNLSYPIIFLPLLLCAFGYFGLYIRSLTSKQHSINILLLIVFLIVGWIGFLPRFVQNTFTIDTIFFFSESYTVATTLVFLFLPSVIDFFRRRKSVGQKQQLLAVVLLTTIALFIGYTKISYLYLGVAVLGYFLLRKGLLKNLKVVLFLLIIVVLSALLYSQTHLIDHDASISLFHFYLSELHTPLRFLWPIIALGWFWIYVVYAIQNQQVLEVELLIVLLIAGILPGNIFHLLGGTANYFSDPVRWISLVLVSAHLDSIFDFYAKWFHQIRYKRVCVVGFGVLCACAVVLNIIFPVRDFLVQNTAERTRMLQLYGTVSVDAATKHLDQAHLFSQLEQLRQLSPAEKKRTALFIPRNSLYWSLSNSCDGAPLLAPAITGIALLDGLPDKSCDYTTYAYRIYDHVGSLSADNLCTTAWQGLCNYAKRKGFDTVIELDEHWQDRPIKKINCAP